MARMPTLFISHGSPLLAIMDSAAIQHRMSKRGRMVIKNLRVKTEKVTRMNA